MSSTEKGKVGMLFITDSALRELLDKLADEYQVIVPVERPDGSAPSFERYRNDLENISLGKVRAYQPLKSFFFRPREVVAKNFEASTPGLEDKPFCLVGVKACDLKGFKVQDNVYLEGDFVDPFYENMRKRNIIISSDCTEALDVCFGMAMGVKPFPQEDFDLNLSEVTGGYLVDVGSDAGRELVDKFASLFSEPDDEHKRERGATRNRVAEAVRANIERESIPDADALEGVIHRQFESELWKEFASTCVECGACNTICPTCHCFLLYDQKDGPGNIERLRIWDSCLLKGFARVAGDENPREHLWERLRNRFVKKFDYFPEVADITACTGCGRCSVACPGDIDIREVLRRLVDSDR